MYFSHDPVFDAPLRKIESLTQKSKRHAILAFLWSATFDYWALRNYEPCERKPGKTFKERGVVKFTISVFSVVQLQL